MRYTKVVNGVIGDITENPGWMDDTGAFLTDSVYIKDYDIYPIVEEHSDDDGYIEKDQDQWIVGVDCVTVTYYTIVSAMPITDRLDTVVIELPKDVWVYDITTNIVEVQYEVRKRTEEEMDYIIENNNISEEMVDFSIYQYKPKQEWLFDGLMVYKTYYTIVPDPQRSEYLDIFYDISTTDRDTWIVDGENIYEKCIFTKKSNILQLKSSLCDAIADYRWKVETGGMFFGEYMIYTDRESQSKITIKYILIKDLGLDEGVTWKTSVGFIGFTVKEFTDMALSVVSFVSDVYNQEHILYNDVQNANDFDQLVLIYDSIETKLNVTDSAYSLYKED